MLSLKLKYTMLFGVNVHEIDQLRRKQKLSNKI